MSLLTDEELNCGVSSFLAEFWGGDREAGKQGGSGDFYQAYLEDRGDKEVKVGAWVGREEQDAYSGESFVNVRDVFYSRVRDGRGIGPKTVPTRECQMYRVEGEEGREGGEKDRVFISTALTFTGVPYGEYFYVQTRWVITRLGVEGTRCRLQIGLEVVFRQTVLLKAAIQSATIAETKKTLQDWLARAKARVLVMKKEVAPTGVMQLLAGGTEGGCIEDEGQERAVQRGGETTGSKGKATMAFVATGAGDMVKRDLSEHQQHQEQQHHGCAEEKCAICVLCRLSSSSSYSSALFLIVPILLLLLLILVAMIMLLMHMERLTLQVQSLQEEIDGLMGALTSAQAIPQQMV
eukprot:evm.model.NODE_21726_length_11577_cov_59.930466.1